MSWSWPLKRSAPLLVALLSFSGSAGPSETEQCEQLPDIQCISSSACTLELTRNGENDYECRATKNYCEEDFIQRTDSATECESKNECIFQPQSCYCPPDLICRCGGGQPPMCVLKIDDIVELPLNHVMQFAPAVPDRRTAGR